MKGFGFSVIQVSVFLVYRLLLLVFNFLHEAFFWRWRKRDGNTLEILKIIYKRKVNIGDMSRPSDFLGIHEKFVEKTELLQPNWSLYTVSPKYAYFVRLPKPLHQYNALEAPFLFVKQFLDAEKMIRMPIVEFLSFAEEIGAPKGRKVVFLSNLARTGSTLLSQMLQVQFSL